MFEPRTAHTRKPRSGGVFVPAMATIRRVGSVPPDRSEPRIPARGAADHWYYSADDAPGRSERERGETRTALTFDGPIPIIAG